MQEAVLVIFRKECNCPVMKLVLKRRPCCRYFPRQSENKTKPTQQFSALEMMQRVAFLPLAPGHVLGELTQFTYPTENYTCILFYPFRLFFSGLTQFNKGHHSQYKGSTAEVCDCEQKFVIIEASVFLGSKPWEFSPQCEVTPLLRFPLRTYQYFYQKAIIFEPMRPCAHPTRI